MTVFSPDRPAWEEGVLLRELHHRVNNGIASAINLVSTAAVGGPPPIGTAGPPSFAGPPAIGPGGAPYAGLGGPAPRLGSRGVPRADLRGPAGFRAGGPAGSARAASVSYSRSGGDGYGGSRYGYRAAYAAGAYAAGAYAGYAYGRSIYGYYPIATATTSTGGTGAFWLAISQTNLGRTDLILETLRWIS